MVEPDNKKHHLQGLGWSVAKTTSLSYHGLLSLLSFSRFTFMNQYFLGVRVHEINRQIILHTQIRIIHPSSAKNLVQASLIARRSFATLSPWHLRGFAWLCPRSPKIIAMSVSAKIFTQTGGIPYTAFSDTATWKNNMCFVCHSLSLSLFLCDGTYVDTYVTSIHPHRFLTSSWPSSSPPGTSGASRLWSVALHSSNASCALCLSSKTCQADAEATQAFNL